MPLKATTVEIPKLVIASFFLVVLIWSTTPLGIVWSSETVAPTLAVLLRMIMGFLIGVIIMLTMSIRLPFDHNAIKLYLVSSIGIVGGMLLSYLAARTVASGTMSLLFGLSPLVSGLLAQKILNEPKFSPMKLFALVLSFTGLAVVCSSKLSISSSSGVGLVLILGAVFLFSLSGVLIKQIEINIHPIANTVGALLFSIPQLALAWLVVDGTLPYQSWEARSLWAIAYLGVFGSLIGFVAYFYILQHLRASTVALVTLITPVFALYIGAQLNQETLTLSLMIGAVLVLLGLTLFQFGERWLKKSEV